MLDLPAVAGSFEVERNKDWRRNWMTSPQDRAALVYLLRSIEAKTVLEIGVNYGLTARCMLDNVASIQRYIGVDVKPGYKPTDERQVNIIPSKPGSAALDDKRFELIVSDRGSLDMTPKDIPSLDAAFIDGDHGYSVASFDTKLAKAKVNPGGLIIWHDYHAGSKEGVRKLLEEMFNAGEKIAHVANTWLAFMKA